MNSLNMKKHVFVEKPLSFEIKEIKEAYEFADKQGKKLVTGWMRRFDK